MDKPGNQPVKQNAVVCYVAEALACQITGQCGLAAGRSSKKEIALTFPFHSSAVKSKDTSIIIGVIKNDFIQFQQRLTR